MQGRQIIFLSLLFLALIAGCASTSKTRPYPPPVSTNVAIPASKPYSEYSLCTDKSPQVKLFADHRAFQVGDTLTVQVVESAIAYNKAQTKTSRSSKASGGVDKFFGIDLADKIPASFSTNTSNSFQGKGETTRSEKLVTTFAVQVVQVLPNGNLVVEGRRDLVVNNERRYMILRGVVRPEDISTNNVVLSTNIANAEIVYSGKGVVADKQKPGWFIRILDNVWPF